MSRRFSDRDTSARSAHACLTRLRAGGRRVSKDAVSIFIALVFLPVYVSGAVRKLAIARIEELEALRNSTVGTKLKFDRAGAVRAVVVQGAAGKGTVSVTQYTVLGFSPPLEHVGREPRA